MKNGKIILIGILAIMAILAIVDIASNIDTIEYLRNEITQKEKSKLDLEQLNVLILKLIFDGLKILTFAASIFFTFKWTKMPKLTFFTLLFLVIIFLSLDLPLHRCYNGNLETYWKVGHHYH